MSKYIVFIEEKMEKALFHRMRIRYATDLERCFIENEYPRKFMPAGDGEDETSELWINVAVHRVSQMRSFSPDCSERMLSLAAEIYSDLDFPVWHSEHAAQAEVLGGEREAVVIIEKRVRREVQ